MSSHTLSQEVSLVGKDYPGYPVFIPLLLHSGQLGHLCIKQAEQFEHKTTRKANGIIRTKNV